MYIFSVKTTKIQICGIENFLRVKLSFQTDVHCHSDSFHFRRVTQYYINQDEVDHTTCILFERV